MTKETDYKKALKASDRIKKALKDTLIMEPEQEDEVEMLRRHM